MQINSMSSPNASTEEPNHEKVIEAFFQENPLTQQYAPQIAKLCMASPGTDDLEKVRNLLTKTFPVPANTDEGGCRLYRQLVSTWCETAQKQAELEDLDAIQMMVVANNIATFFLELPGRRRTEPGVTTGSKGTSTNSKYTSFAMMHKWEDKKSVNQGEVQEGTVLPGRKTT